MTSNLAADDGEADWDALAVPRLAPLSGGPARQLVVLCHGHGGNGRQQLARARRLGKSLRHTAFLCPHGPEAIKNDDPAKRRWFATSAATAEVRAEDIQSAAAALNDLVDAELARLGPLPGGYALMGFSQGASVVLAVGLNRAVDPPCALLAFAGMLAIPRGYRPMITSRPPTLISHGEVDPVVPIEAARETAEILRAAGVPVKTLWLPEVGHEIEQIGIRAAAQFLRQHFRRAPQVPA